MYGKYFFCWQFFKKRKDFANFYREICEKMSYTIKIYIKNCNITIDFNVNYKM